MNQKIKVLLYSSNIWYLAEGMFGPLLAIFTEEIGGDIFDISWAWAAYLIATGVITIVVGKLLSHSKYVKTVMIIGYGLNALLTFGYLFVETPLQLFIIQVALGIATALATPTWSTLYARHSDKELEVFEWGLASGESNIITGIAIIIGGYIVGSFSFNLLFMIMGIIQTISTLYLIIFYNRK